MGLSNWQKVCDGVFLFQDSCCVYAVQGPKGTVLINAGTGLVADYLDEVFQNGSLTVLLTHHFRDHTDGAIRLRNAGAKILAPYWEQEYLTDPEQHFRERQIWNSYDNRWDRFAPVRPIPVSNWMMDYENREIAGLKWEVVPTPGCTNGASSYVVDFNGLHLAFVGELICGLGYTSRLAPLQYNYNDFTGAANLWKSCYRLMENKLDMLLPSLGQPIDRPGQAIQLLRQNLKLIGGISPGFVEQLNDPDDDDIEEILPHLYRSKYSSAETNFVISDSGKVMAIDYGYNTSAYQSPGKQHLSNRRPFLHGIKGLKKKFGIDQIDTILVSHFHDDHVNGIPMLQRVFGTEVWAGDHFSDILENPTHYDRPCLWHEPISVSRHLPNEDVTYWENIPIRLYPMSGHTRFSTLICLEVDGKRVVHTGDQIFFSTSSGLPFDKDAQPFTNHVYKNGLDLGCYKQTLKLLRDFQPDWVLTGHTKPYQTSPEWYQVIEKGANAFDEVHLHLMSLGDDDVHFGAESQGGKLRPYRLHLRDGGEAKFKGWILNPFSIDQKAVIKLVGPDDWKSQVIEVELRPREQKEIHISILPPDESCCRRQPIGLDLTVGGRPFGQVAEALVSVGVPRF